MHRNISLTVDAIAVKENRILLIRRKNQPFRGSYALPGGFVEYGETVEKAVIREFREETGLEAEIRGLVGIYSEPDRDPRGHTVNIVFRLRITGGKMQAGDDAAEIAMFPLDNLPELAFDHLKIIADYLAMLADSEPRSINQT